jgi:endonuclease YncB( thermonuclease family)
MKRIIFFLLAFFLYQMLFAGDSLSGRVKSVIDGNTLEVEVSGNEVFTILLEGIDSPELGQEYGDHAKALLEKLTLQKKVTITFTGKDRKGNQLATVLLHGKVDVRLELLKEGLAWTAERNPLPDLESVKESARQNTKGLWKQENPTPPWVYRRQQTMLQVKGS